MAQRDVTRLGAAVAHFRLDAHQRRGLVGLRVSHEHAAARRGRRQHLVGHVHWRLDGQADAAIQAAVLNVVEVLERLGTGDLVVFVVDADRDLVRARRLQYVGHVKAERQVAAQMLAEVLAVDPDIGHVHGRLESQNGALAPLQPGSKILLVEGLALPRIDRFARLEPGRVRQVHARPCSCRYLGAALGALLIIAIKLPGTVQVDCRGDDGVGQTGEQEAGE